MNYEQLASFEPALAEFLEKVRHCFKRDKTFSYMQKYILGLMADLKRKSIEPIALANGVAVRTLQEFLAFFKWDHQLVEKTLIREVIERQHNKVSIGVLDASAHTKLIPNKAKKLPVFSVNGAAKQVSVIIAFWVSICFIQIMTRKIRLVALLPVIYIFLSHGMKIATAVSVPAFLTKQPIALNGR